MCSIFVQTVSRDSPNVTTYIKFKYYNIYFHENYNLRFEGDVAFTGNCAFDQMRQIFQNNHYPSKLNE